MSSRSSPMALNPITNSPSIFKKKSSTPLSAASYLAAVSHADSVRRGSAMSIASSSTANESTLSSLSTHSRSSTSGTSVYDGAMTTDDEPDVYCDDKLKIPAVPPNSTQVFTTRHVEFGHCANPDFRYTSQHVPGTEFEAHNESDPPYYILFTTYLSYVILICIGHMRDFFGKRLFPASYTHLAPHKGYAPLNSDFDSFYTRRLKHRLDDCFARPVTNVPGRTITLVDRYSDDYNDNYQYTGTKSRALNVSSYNYLGFAQARGGCADAVEESLRRYGISSCGPRMEGGTTDLHLQAEALVARFVGKEDAIISSMGFATNSTALPALVEKGSLVISDEHNHASIRVGLRLSGAHIRTFKHNDMAALEKLLRECISQGQPRTHRPWKKILVVVEGLYSMEGSFVDLPKLVQLKKRYKFYLYVDEAHSIGAMGPQGRGVCNYFHVPPSEVDILMGTFTKSFGASGGYIAGSKAIISRLRTRVHGSSYAESIAPAVLTQIIASMGSIMGVADSNTIPVTVDIDSSVAGIPDANTPGFEHLTPAPGSALPSWLSLPKELRDGSEGRERLRRLAFNARYLSRGLQKLGLLVWGNTDSPVIPVMIFNPGKMPMFSRLMLERQVPIVTVVVGYPATALITSRVRICLSASHTKEDIDLILEACDEVGDILDMKHGTGERWPLEEIKARAVELVTGEF